MSEAVYEKTVNAMRFIRVLRANQVQEFMQFLGEWNHEPVWEVLSMMIDTVEFDTFMPEWQERNGIIKVTLDAGDFLADHQVRIIFQNEASYAMFTLSHGMLSLDY